MARPVIIDDGGSIRIRELQDDKKMDGLIGSFNAAANALVFASASSQQFFGAGSADNQCLLLVTSVDDSGTLTLLPLNAGLYGQKLAAGDTVIVTSADGQTITITFPGGVLNVALSASASAFERKRRRRYIMAADVIQSVTWNNAAIFTAGNPSPASTVVSFLDEAPFGNLAERIRRADRRQETY
jgi:hypothetical protein